jgi:capsular exopolysaccharide synthesis family protein
MDTRFIRRLIRRRWRTVAAGGGLIGLLILIINLFRPSVYQASATLLVNQHRGLSAPSYESVLMSQQLTRTYAELLKKRPLYEMVITNLRLETTPDRLMQNVRVSTIRDTQLIVVTARDRSPERAADIANELARLLREQDRQLLAGGYASGERGLSVVEPARADPVPASPKVLRDTLLGLIFGVLGMFGIALVREYVDESIKDGNDAAQAAGAPVLGTIGNRAQADHAQRASVDNIDGAYAEPYRLLAVRMRSALADHPARSLIVTSAEPLADTHAVAVHLAVIYAQLGQRIILIDGDLRQPTLHSWFNLQGDAGVRDVLEGAQHLPVYRYLLPTSVANLMLLPGGKPVPNPLILLDSPRLSKCIRELDQHADLTIIVAPALLNTAGTLLMAQAADAAILVMRAEVTKSAAAASARTILDQAHVRLSGVVLTGAVDDDSALLIDTSLFTLRSEPMPGKRLRSPSPSVNEKSPHSTALSSASAISSHSSDQ